MDIETAEAVDTLRTDIHRLEKKIENVGSALTAKMDEQKRHTDVRLESMHDDIRMLAGHVASLSEKFDSRH